MLSDSVCRLLKSRDGEYLKLLCKATYLDPRFVLTINSINLSVDVELQISDYVEEIKQELATLIDAQGVCLYSYV